MPETKEYYRVENLDDAGNWHFAGRYDQQRKAHDAAVATRNAGCSSRVVKITVSETSRTDGTYTFSSAGRGLCTNEILNAIIDEINPVLNKGSVISTIAMQQVVAIINRYMN